MAWRSCPICSVQEEQAVCIIGYSVSSLGWSQSFFPFNSVVRQAMGSFSRQEKNNDGDDQLGMPQRDATPSPTATLTKTAWRVLSACSSPSWTTLPSSPSLPLDRVRLLLETDPIRRVSSWTRACPCSSPTTSFPRGSGRRRSV